MLTKTLSEFKEIQTPFYYYDMKLLHRTLRELSSVAQNYRFTIHYAVKANANAEILQTISSYGFSADCVSGNEIERAVTCGFKAEEIVYAGVGKTNQEIIYALKTGIFCFNAESIQEIEVINFLASECNIKAHVSIRINPDLDAHTHEKINTGTGGTKFGIGRNEIDKAIAFVKKSQNIEFLGLHFHTGSQITDMSVFEKLAELASYYVTYFNENGLYVQHLNLGGGLGVDYQNPLENPIPDFNGWMKAIANNLDIPSNTKIHLEPGRSIVAQCGSLITKVLYTKPGLNHKIVIVDAGFTDLIRPALYGAYHNIINISSQQENEICDVAGPICECTDYFSKGISLPVASRGDFLSVMSAGAYGQVMVSEYNLRSKPGTVYSGQLMANSQQPTANCQLPTTDYFIHNT